MKIRHSIPIVRSPRVQQLCGLFDLPPQKRSELEWDVDLPLDAHPWNVGLIVGPSGCGKSTIARELFGPAMISGFDWPAKASVVDAFPDLPIKEITGLLSSVGFSSPPAWLRPFGCLSNGEQFRVMIARALAEQTDLAVIDEFTSVVDRTVAQIGSHAVAKTVRRRKQRLVAVTCHYDVIDWLDPDWIYDPSTGEFRWRLERRRRPPIEIEIRSVSRTAWRLFKHHHYLSGQLNPLSRCFAAFVDGRPAVFSAVIHFPHFSGHFWREHRTVCLPDFQGCGIGNAVSEHLAGAFAATGKRFNSATGHPAMIHHRARSPLWDMRRKPGQSSASKDRARANRKAAVDRITAGFIYCGPADAEAARKLGIPLP